MPCCRDAVTFLRVTPLRHAAADAFAAMLMLSLMLPFRFLRRLRRRFSD